MEYGATRLGNEGGDVQVSAAIPAGVEVTRRKRIARGGVQSHHIIHAAAAPPLPFPRSSATAILFYQGEQRYEHWQRGGARWAGSCRRGRGHMMSSSASRPGPSQPTSADALVHVAEVGVGEENTRLQDGGSGGVGCKYEGLMHRHRGDKGGAVQLCSFGSWEGGGA
jgi:hypothetical protein